MVSKRFKGHILRYTKLEFLITMLDLEMLILRPYHVWDDKNDIHFMKKYAEINQFPNIFCMCATMAYETHHHWKMFANGEDGVCIMFKKQALEQQLSKLPQIRAGEVKYLQLKQLEKLSINNFRHNLPFLKRIGFKDEIEYRIIYNDNSEEYESKYIPVNLSCIEKIILNPEADKYQHEETIDRIHDIPNCGSIKIEISRLTNSQNWKQTTDRLSLNR